MPIAGQLLRSLGKMGLKRLGFEPIAEDILKEPEYVYPEEEEQLLEEPSVEEPMTFEELQLELEGTAEGLRITPEFALEHDLEIPEGEEWFAVPNPDIDVGYEITPIKTETKAAPQDWRINFWNLPWSVKQKPPSLKEAIEAAKPEDFNLIEPEPSRTFAWDHKQRRYIEDTEENVKKQLKFYAEHPMLGPPPKRVTEDQYFAHRDEVLGKIFPGETEEEVGEFINSDPEGFYDYMSRIGQTKDTVEFFATFFPNTTAEEIELFFDPMSYIPDKPLVEVPLGTFKISRQPVEAIRGFFVKDPDSFRIAVLLEGRTPETEELVREMFRSGERPLSYQGGLIAAQRAVHTPWTEYFGQEIPDGVLDVYFKDDLAAKFVRGDYLPGPLQDYAKVFVQGWGDLAAGAAGTFSRIGADAAAKTMTLEAIEANIVARDVDWGSGIGWYAKQFTRMVPFVLTTVATSVIPGMGAFNLLRAAGVSSTTAKFGASVAGGVASSITEGMVEAGTARNEAIQRGFTTEEANYVYDRVLAGNVGLLSLTNTAQLGAVLFTPVRGAASYVQKVLMFGAGAASESFEEGGQLIISRYFLGDDALKFDDEFRASLKLGFMGGVGFQAGAQLFTTFTGMLSTRMDEAMRLKWEQDVAQGKLLGFSEREAEIRAYDIFSETPEGEAAVEQSVALMMAEEKAEAVKELPKAMETFAIFDSLYADVAAETREKARKAAEKGIVYPETKALPEGKATLKAKLKKATARVQRLENELQRTSPPLHLRKTDVSISPDYPVGPTAKWEALRKAQAEEEVLLQKLGYMPPPEVAKPAISPEAKAIVEEHLPKAEAPTVPLQEHIEKLPTLLSETPNARNLQKLEGEIAKLTEDQVDGLSDVTDAIEEYRGIQKKGLTPEDYRDQKAEAWDSIVEAVENLSAVEEADVITTEPPPPPAPSEQQEMSEMLDKPTKTEAQADYAIDLFAKYLSDPSQETAMAIQEELWRQERGLRAARFQEEYEKLIMEGVTESEAYTQAKATLSGPLPRMRNEDIPVFSAEMVNALHAKIDHFFADKPDMVYEAISTKEALTNALAGNRIPREPGVKGGSAFSRLQRVFGYETVKAIDTGKPLLSAIEDIQKRIAEGTSPVGVDPLMREYIAELSDVPFGQAAFMPEGTEILRTLADPRTATQKKFAKAVLDLGIALDNKTITKDDYDLQMTEAYDNAFPNTPLTPEILDYIRSLRDVFSGQTSFLEPLMAAQGKPSLIEGPVVLRTLQDQRTAAERLLAKQELEIELAKPPQPPTRPPLPPGVEKAMKSNPMFPQKMQRDLAYFLKKIGLTAIRIGNFMRANKSSFDLSFWRQQSPLILNHMLTFRTANVVAWKAVWSQEVANANWEWITHDVPYHFYDEMVREENKGDFLRVPTAYFEKGMPAIRTAEEYGFPTGDDPISKLTHKIPYIKMSQRAFETGTNMHNWLIYRNHYYDMLRYEKQIASGKVKLEPGEAFSMKKEMRDYAVMLTDMTGRASLGKASPAGPALSAVFFAARYKLARAIVPRHLFSPNPRVRKEAWRDLTTFVAGIGGLLALGAVLGLWEVERDPRSTNVGQIRIGNTRIDPWGGFRPHYVFLARLIDGTGLSGDTGMEYQADPISATAHFVRGSLSPGTALLVDAVQGKTFIGEEFDVANPKQMIERMAPFFLQDFYEAYQESPSIAAITAIPGFFGAGITTYTGDWKEDKQNLGLPKYEDGLLEYGVTEPIYDVKDFWADTAGDFKGVDPESLTEKSGFPPYIKALAEAVQIKDELSLMPNQSLVSINADPAKGTTFVQYYKMWQDRQKLEGDALKEFDADERTRDAHLGNMTQRQYALLVEYHSLVSDYRREQFLIDHPELNVNTRDSYLKAHPEDNAKLAIWGQEDVLTQEAYDIARKLIEEFDIPDIAVAEYLPPDNVASAYFERNDIAEQWGSNSWEDKLFRAKNPELNKWLGLATVTDSVPSLELKVQYRTQFEQYDAYGERGSKFYVADSTARAEARAKFLDDNLQFKDAKYRTEAYDTDVPEKLVDKYVAYYMLPEGSQRKAFLRDNSDFYDYWVYGLDHDEVDFSSIGGEPPFAPAKPIGMHLLSTEEIVNILSGEPARSWWEGVAWKFGMDTLEDVDIRAMLAALGATPEEIEQLLKLVGSTYEGRTIESLDQLAALVDELRRTEGMTIREIISKIKGTKDILGGALQRGYERTTEEFKKKFLG